MSTELEVFRFLPEDRTIKTWLRKRMVKFEKRDPNDGHDTRLEKLEKYAVDLRADVIKAMVTKLVDPANEDRRKIETEISDDRLSTPRGNIVRRGNFDTFAGGVPIAWVSSGATGMTLSSAAARTTSQEGNKSCRIQTDTTHEGGIWQAVDFYPGRRHTFAFGLKITTASAYFKVESDGANPLAERYDLLGSDWGVGEWMCFPSIQSDMIHVDVPEDATYVNLFLGAAPVGGVAADVYWTDVQGGQGTSRLYEMWQSHFDDANNARAIIKRVDESVTNVTTGTNLQNDDELQVPIRAYEARSFRFVLNCKAALATTGIKVAIVVPSGTVEYMVFRTNLAAQTFYGEASASGTSIDLVAASWATTGQGQVVIEGSCINGATAGNIILQWAQSTGSATQLSVKAGSKVESIGA